MRTDVAIFNDTLEDLKKLVEPRYSRDTKTMVNWVLVHWIEIEKQRRESHKQYLTSIGFSEQEYDRLSKLTPEECPNCSKDGSKKCRIHFLYD